MKINLPFLSLVPSCFIFAFALSLFRGPDYQELGDIYPPKHGFHMSGKSQTIGDFTFRPPSQILPINIGLDYNYHAKWPKNVSGNFQMFFLNISKKF